MISLPQHIPRHKKYAITIGTKIPEYSPHKSVSIIKYGRAIWNPNKNATVRGIKISPNTRATEAKIHPRIISVIIILFIL